MSRPQVVGERTRRTELTRTRLVREGLLEPTTERASRVGSAIAYNFRACDRDQAFLLPPDVRDWLPTDHLAWFVLDVVDQLDLGPFLKAYRAYGHGRAAYLPRMLLGVLLYAYCSGIRSSRQIERRCTEDIAFRVLAGNCTPDHVTIARRVRHEQALAGLLVQSLKANGGDFEDAVVTGADSALIGVRDGSLYGFAGGVLSKYGRSLTSGDAAIVPATLAFAAVVVCRLLPSGCRAFAACWPRAGPVAGRPS